MMAGPKASDIVARIGAFAYLNCELKRTGPACCFGPLKWGEKILLPYMIRGFMIGFFPTRLGCILGCIHIWV